MKREKEVPAELLTWLEQQKQRVVDMSAFSRLDIYCTIPVRAVKMKILEHGDSEGFHTVIIPAVDIYTTGKNAIFKNGYLRRDALMFFVSGTRRAFPYGHVYANSGSICLGSLFVPSAVPEKSPAMPLETLFLHNDRNLSHGNAHLHISWGQAEAIEKIIKRFGIRLSDLAETVISKPTDIIANDEIWCLSADVAEQKPLPEALHIMSEIYDVIFVKTEGEETAPESEEQ